MNISIKAALVSTRFLKVSALIIGYSLWSFVGEAFPATLWLSVPLCFYNQTATIKIDAPEKLWVKLHGKRSYLHRLDNHTLAAHINAQELHVGPQNYTITAKSLLLPSTITVSETIPHTLLFTLSQESI
ncbi:hypothetical protein H0X48_01760 [Candidatus Dependentiae bacterium]|nr:hypothetical protein [Candidatus Dependentiae bacterium]